MTTTTVIVPMIINQSKLKKIIGFITPIFKITMNRPNEYMTVTTIRDLLILK